MLKHQEKSRTNENQADEISSQGKGGLKQFGSSQNNKPISRHAEAGLKIKSNVQEIQVYKNEKNSSKQSLLPQKRTELNAGLKVRGETKKQHIQPIEKTYRRCEEEIEWAPEGLDLDFSSFDSSVRESDYQAQEPMFSMNTEELPVTTRRFQVNEEPATTTIQDISPVIEHDTSTIEYGPPKEQEPAYVPDESCVVDIKQFNGYADINAYESIRLSAQDNDAFSLFDDVDALVQIQLSTAPAITFDYYSSDDDVTTDELDMTTNELDIPFSDYTFDVEHFIQCN